MLTVHHAEYQIKSTPARLKCEIKYTHVEYISDETVTYDGDRALPQRGAVEVVLGVKRATQHSEADKRVQVEDHEAEHSDPQ